MKNIKSFTKLINESDGVITQAYEAAEFFSSMQKGQPYEDFGYKLVGLLMRMDGADQPSDLSQANQRVLVGIANQIKEENG